MKVILACQFQYEETKGTKRNHKKYIPTEDR